MDLPLLMAAASVGTTMLALVWYVGLGIVRSGERTGHRLASLQTRDELLESNFNERALAPLAGKLGKTLMRFTPMGWAANATKQLGIAGWAPRIDANAWAAMRVMAVVGALLLFILLQGLLPPGQRVLIFGFFVVASLLGPRAVLSRRVKERQERIARGLPDVIDLLVISVEAGLGFEAALARVVANVPGELSDEFARVLAETRIGVSRYDAMKNLAARTEVEQLNSFILAMHQADQFGVSIARMLRVQADDIRVRRRQKVQERAFAAPVKMVFPLVLCIFPGIFVVLLGPAAVQIAGSLGNL